MESSTRKIARVSRAGNQVAVNAPYDPQFVSRLKAETKSRRWNPDKKVWTVDAKERQKLLEIAGAFFQVVEDNEPSEVASPAARTSAEPDEAPSGVSMASVVKPGSELDIWTDGACAVNPGPGGYGVVFKYQGHVWEKAGGYRLTTNNRMEITGALVALEALPEKCKVTIYTDSQYVVNSVSKGWAKRWSSKGWMKTTRERVPNSDLWKRMLQLCERHEVDFQWIRGHDVNVENERCDRLAESARRKPDLPVDEGYLPGQ